MTTGYVLQNLKLVNGKVVDIVVVDGEILRISSAGSESGNCIIDFDREVYVSSGWIDMHVHAYSDLDPYGDDLDEIGYKSGVTTVVDAGSTGADRIGNLIDYSKRFKTNLLAFLNISRVGLQRMDELSEISLLDESILQEAICKYNTFIIGLKARMSKSVVGENNITPLKIAREFSKNTNLPLMVHIGSGPPSINKILNLLEEGDVITHFLNAKENNLFNDLGQPLPSLLRAIDRGVHLDVGHGNASFSFPVAEQAKERGIQFNTISTDIYRKNRLYGPVYSMSNLLTKFLYLGYALNDIIDAVTVNAANWLNKPDMGKVQSGQIANLTLFSVENEPMKITDSEGNKMIAEQHIQVKGVVINGEYIEC